MASLRRRAGTAGALAFGVLLGGSQGTDVHAQQQFDLFVAVVSDHSLPVRLTILVDNGSGMTDALVHYRTR
jgi:hypothetical protein